MKIADDVMKKLMEFNLTIIQNAMKNLECLVHEMDNTMNECCCSDRKMFDFRNVSTEPEQFLLCLNCGGHIEWTYLEDCEIF